MTRFRKRNIDIDKKIDPGKKRTDKKSTEKNGLGIKDFEKTICRKIMVDKKSTMQKKKPDTRP